jgi:hypothetical protein
MSKECPICYDFIKKGVKCCHGHEVCEKHFIERARAIYEEGRLACHHDHFQKCFICREEMGDDRFSESYHNLLRLTQFLGMAKHMGLSKDEIYYKLKLMRELENDKEKMKKMKKEFLSGQGDNFMTTVTDNWSSFKNCASD